MLLFANIVYIIRIRSKSDLGRQRNELKRES